MPFWFVGPEKKEKCHAISGTQTHDSRSRAQVFNHSATCDPSKVYYYNTATKIDSEAYISWKGREGEA